MNTPHVYDKSKYHYESVEELGLPVEHASNHVVFFLRWLIENSFISNEFSGSEDQFMTRYRNGEISIHELYESWDNCLIDDMLTDEGNAFAMNYFEFESGKYLYDHARVLKRDSPSEFEVVYSEENYRLIKPVIDNRYKKFKSGGKRFRLFK